MAANRRELINAADTTISKHKSASLQDEVGPIAHRSACQPCATASKSTSAHAAASKLVRGLQQL
jgi:hypothetical protein